MTDHVDHGPIISQEAAYCISESFDFFKDVAGDSCVFDAITTDEYYHHDREEMVVSWIVSFVPEQECVLSEAGFAHLETVGMYIDARSGEPGSGFISSLLLTSCDGYPEFSSD